MLEVLAEGAAVAEEEEAAAEAAEEEVAAKAAAEAAAKDEAVVGRCLCRRRRGREPAGDHLETAVGDISGAVPGKVEGRGYCNLYKSAT